MIRTKLGLFAGVLTLTAAATPAYAWGPLGHETVAYIAEDNLTDTAKSNIELLLGRDVDLAAIANWADEVRDSRPETAPWHFIDIEDRVPETEADEPKFCPNHECVVDQIALEIATLKKSSASTAQRTEALRFLVHFVGDVHQPLHAADDNDRGGNDKLVQVKASHGHKATTLKLHALWDRLVEVKNTEDPRELASELALTDAQRNQMQKGTSADWAFESFQIAHDSIYSELKPGPTNSSKGVPLPADYSTDKMTNIVHQQLQRAGARLAFLLNDIFG